VRGISASMIGWSINVVASGHEHDMLNSVVTDP